MVGVRTIDSGNWYGEGEVKIYTDGDDVFPTICGTGLEDYVGTAWGMGIHSGPYAGAPLIVPDPADRKPDDFIPELVGFYRWHLADPIMFERELKVTIQQIGLAIFPQDRKAEFDAFASVHSAAQSWKSLSGTDFGLFERQDDYSAAAFVYCRSAQSVPAYDSEAASADLSFSTEEEFLMTDDEQQDRLNKALLNL